MLAIRLPQEIEGRLDALAKTTGRSKAHYVWEAILVHLDDLDDLYLAEQRLIDIRPGRRTPSPWMSWRSHMAWRIELEPAAGRARRSRLTVRHAVSDAAVGREGPARTPSVRAGDHKEA